MVEVGVVCSSVPSNLKDVLVFASLKRFFCEEAGGGGQ